MRLHSILLLAAAVVCASVPTAPVEANSQVAASNFAVRSLGDVPTKRLLRTFEIEDEDEDEDEEERALPETMEKVVGAFKKLNFGKASTNVLASKKFSQFARFVSKTDDKNAEQLMLSALT